MNQTSKPVSLAAIVVASLLLAGCSTLQSAYESTTDTVKSVYDSTVDTVSGWMKSDDAKK